MKRLPNLLASFALIALSLVAAQRGAPAAESTTGIIT